MLLCSTLLCLLPQATPPQVDLDAAFSFSEKFGNHAPAALAWLNDHQLRIHGLPPDSERDEVPSLHVIDFPGGRWEPLYDARKMERALAATPEIAPREAPALARRADYVFLPESRGVLFHANGKVFRYLYGGERANVVVADDHGMMAESLSPDGTWLAFVRAGNLHVAACDGGGVRPLTSDGGPDLLNGVLDWVYQEEIYGRGNYSGLWWSPDSKRIAFLQLDEHPVHTFRIEDHIPVRGAQELERYPKAGDPNPRVRAGVVGVVSGKRQWMDLSAFSAEDRLVRQVSWSPDGGTLALEVSPREQRSLTLLLCDPENGSVRPVLVEESAEGWTERSPLHWLGSDEFLWESQRSGFRHLYRYRTDGTLLGQLDSGEWRLRSVLRIDRDAGMVWFTAPGERLVDTWVYRMPLSGGPRVAVLKGRGTHAARVAPGGNYLLDTWSSAADPGWTAVVDGGSGEEILELSHGDADALAISSFVPPDFFTVPNRQGFSMQAMLYRPPDFVEGKGYPVLVHVYGGPDTPLVRDRFGGFTAAWHSALANAGYLVWTCDNRSASGRSHADAQVMFHRAGVTELQDLEDGLDWLVGKGWVDPARIGIWGWSYGGYMSSYALTHSTRFRVGVAVAPVTDWRNYDSIYTERFMGTPQDDPEGYRVSSVVEAAKHLHGSFLLVHGSIDDNVHLSNSLQLAYALERADRPFRMMIYPKSRHGIRDPRLRRHLFGMLSDFILERL